MATSDEAPACVPKPLVDLSCGNTLERMEGKDIASSSTIPDKLTSIPSEVTTRAEELHGGKQDTFRSELYVTDTDVEDICLTETELESSSYAEQISLTAKHAGPQSDIDVRGVSQLDHALTENKSCNDISVTKPTSAVATSSCPPTELDSSLSASASSSRTESTSSSPSAERGERKIDNCVKSRSRSRTYPRAKCAISTRRGFRGEAGEYVCCSRAKSEIGYQAVGLD